MKRLVAVVLISLLLTCTSSVASTLLFTDRSAWLSYSFDGGHTVANIDFENAKASNNIVVAGDVVFSTLPWVPLEIRDYGIPYGSGKVLYPAFNSPIQVVLPADTYAFGFDLGEVGGIVSSDLPTLGNIVLSTGEVFAGPFYGNPFPTYAFFGFRSDVPVTGLSMMPDAFIEPIIDNFSYAQDGPVPSPEPSSLILLSSGLLSILAGKWRSNQRRPEM